MARQLDWRRSSAGRQVCKCGAVSLIALFWFPEKTKISGNSSRACGDGEQLRSLATLAAGRSWSSS